MNLHDALNQHGIPLPPAHLKPNTAGFLRWENYWLKQVEGVALFGNWETGESYHWFEDTATPLDAKQIAARKAKVAAMHKEREADILHQHEQAALAALAEWAGLCEDGQSEYLTQKQVQGFGIRYGQGGSIVVPVRDTAGKIWSLQTIQPDGSKRFSAGGRKKGLYHEIGQLENADTVFVAEGYATGASVHMATDSPVVVAFDAGNLDSVIAAIRAAQPNLTIIIAADSDQWKPVNVGKEKAHEAAKKHGCVVALPVFDSALLDSKPTDFNDLHVMQGAEVVRKQLEQCKPLICRKQETGYWASDLQYQKFLPVKYVVKGYIVEGLTILAGKPKTGKSWLCLDIAIAVARGGSAFGSIVCEAGDVLYMALTPITDNLDEHFFDNIEAMVTDNLMQES